MKKKLINGVRYILATVPVAIGFVFGLFIIDATEGWGTNGK